MKDKWLFRIASVLIVVFLMSLVVPVQAGTKHRRRHNPEAGKRKALKRIGIGTAIGAGAGGIVGGRKGAAIGAGVGAGAGTAYHYHKKRKWRRRHPR